MYGTWPALETIGDPTVAGDGIPTGEIVTAPVVSVGVPTDAAGGMPVGVMDTIPGTITGTPTATEGGTPTGVMSCSGPITVGVPTAATGGTLGTWMTTIPVATAGTPTTAVDVMLSGVAKSSAHHPLISCYRAKIRPASFGQITVMSPPFGVTANPVAVSM